MATYRMLKKFASGVFASLKGSTYHRARAAKAAQGGWVRKVYASPLRHWALTDSRPSADVTLILLRVADLAAALLDSLFEPPEPATLLHNERSRFAGQGATDILGIGDQSGLSTPFYEFDHRLNLRSHAASVELIVRVMFLRLSHGHAV